MPSDSLFIRSLFATFPDAKVIWTHRDPYATFASSISMRTNGRKIFNKDPDIPYMQQRFPFQMACHVMRPLEMSRFLSAAPPVGKDAERSEPEAGNPALPLNSTRLGRKPASVLPPPVGAISSTEWPACVLARSSIW